jgi:hypothetical protein
MSALPNAINYSAGSPSLPPNARSTDIVLRPSNGSVFSENATIAFDFNATSGFIDPTSIYLRYKYAFTNLVGAEMKGTPVYTPFQRLNAYIGSVQAESISQYNQTMNMLVQLTHGVSDKYGLQPGYGYFNNTSAPTLAQLDGRVLTVNETGTFSAPLPCMFSNCERYIPVFAMPQLRLELVVSTLADMFRGDTVAVPTVITLSNLELCYRQVDFGADVEAMVRSSGLSHIKTHSQVNSAALLAASTSGQVALVYNARLASIKSAFILGANSKSASNQAFDAVDLTKSNGSYQITIAGKNYPATSLNTAINKAGIFQSLRGAVGSVYSKDNNCAINAVEFNVLDGASPTLAEPGKFIVGIDCEILGSASDYIMSGTSSQNSAITVVLQLGTATTDAHNVNLVLDYDALIEVDFATGQASVKM